MATQSYSHRDIFASS